MSALQRHLKKIDAVNHKLLEAARAGKEDALREALGGAKVLVDFHESPDHSTPLLLACEAGSSACVKLLVDAKANANQASSSGMCASPAQHQTLPPSLWSTS